jgi:poly(3-hydroxybutyrate) depolymerase
MSSPAARLLTEFAVTPLRIVSSAMTSWADYTALPPKSTPLTDLLAWCSALTKRERPRWAHHAPVVRDWPLARLRDYSTTSAPDMIPTLVLPPQAGHGSCIADYAADQSQLLSLREAGLSRLYCLDWVGATEQTAGASIEDYLALLAETVRLLGGRVNVVGDCQGGWLAVIYAALHPDQVHTLTIAGAPIDFHAGSSPLRDWTSLLGTAGRAVGGTELTAYQAMVALGGGVQRGANQLLGFKLLEPAAEWERNLALLAHIRDPERVARHIEFTSWFEWTQDIPGAFYLWIVEHLFINNELVAGELMIGGQRVRLSSVRCPLFLIAGDRDHITPPDQVWALTEHAASEHVHRQLVPAGHLGLFTGREALRDHWLPLMRRVRALS